MYLPRSGEGHVQLVAKRTTCSKRSMALIGSSSYGIIGQCTPCTWRNLNADLEDLTFTKMSNAFVVQEPDETMLIALVSFKF